MKSEEEQLRSRTQGKRYLQLDALRGIAAVCVVFYHLDRAFQRGPIRVWAVPLFSGPQAVNLFFVLSGFVLSLPYLDGKPQRYWPYLIRRFWRIWVPFAAAVFLSAAGALTFRRYHLPLPPWYYVTWQTPVTVWIIIQQLLMVPLSVLNTAFWSLSVEVQFSILMPFIAAFVRRSTAVLLIAAFVIWGLSWPLLSSQWRILGPSLPSLQFGPLFLLGSILAKYRASVVALLQRAPRGGYVSLCITFALYCNLHRDRWPMAHALEKNQALISGLGSAGILACALALPAFASALKHKLPEYLGKISYSLYLTHSIVIFSVLDLLYGRVPRFLIIMTILVLAFALAHVFNAAIEEPANRIGKALARRSPKIVSPVGT